MEYLIWRDAFVDDTSLVEIPDSPASIKATSTEKAAGSSTKSVSATKTAVKPGKKQSVKKQSAGKSRRNGGMKTIDKIRLLADWAEKTMMPPPGSPWAEISKLQDRLFAATQVIKLHPNSFLTHPAFLELIELGKKQIADEEKYPFRLTASLPLTDLRKTIYGTVNVDNRQLQKPLTAAEKRKVKAKLGLLPLPVSIEVHPEITGTHEEIMVFNWFRCSGPEQAKEVVDMIPKFFLALIEALDDLPTITHSSQTAQ